MADVVVDLRNLKGLQRMLATEARGVGSTPLRKVYRQWAARYRSFVLRRFVKASRGDGTWPPLKPGTIARRRKGKGVGMIAAILIDTGTLRTALDVQFKKKPGQFQRDIPGGIIVGFGGPARHGKGSATIAEIAAYHQAGKGKLPKRELLVKPNRETVNRMKQDMLRAIKRFDK